MESPRRPFGTGLRPRRPPVGPVGEVPASGVADARHADATAVPVARPLRVDRRAGGGRLARPVEEKLAGEGPAVLDVGEEDETPAQRPFADMGGGREVGRPPVVGVENTPPTDNVREVGDAATATGGRVVRRGVPVARHQKHPRHGLLAVGVGVQTAGHPDSTSRTGTPRNGGATATGTRNARRPATCRWGRRGRAVEACREGPACDTGTASTPSSGLSCRRNGVTR